MTDIEKMLRDKAEKVAEIPNADVEVMRPHELYLAQSAGYFQQAANLKGVPPRPDTVSLSAIKIGDMVLVLTEANNADIYRLVDHIIEEVRPHEPIRSILDSSPSVDDLPSIRDYPRYRASYPR